MHILELSVRSEVTRQDEWRWRQRGGKDAIIPHEVRQWNTSKKGNNEKGI